MGWREFIESHLDTLGVTLFFAALSSAFMVKAREHTVRPTFGRALLVFGGGQIVGASAMSFVTGYLGWSIFVAPVVGSVCGISGMFILMAAIRAGQRIEDRGGEIGDAAVDAVKRRGGQP